MVRFSSPVAANKPRKQTNGVHVRKVSDYHGTAPDGTPDGTLHFAVEYFATMLVH
jgi:hypothetical protein